MCANSRPTSPGKSIEDVARDLNLDPASIVKLASNENPRGPSPTVLAAIAAAAGEITRYPDGNGFALKAALSRSDLASIPRRSCSAMARTTSWNSSTQAYPARRRRGDLRAARVCRLSAGHPGARRRSASKCRRTNYGHDLSRMRAADHAAHAHRLRRQSEQSDRNVHRRRPNSRRSSRRCRATCSSCSTRPTTSTSNRPTRADSVALDRAPSESRRVALVLEGATDWPRCASATASWTPASRTC